MLDTVSWYLAWMQKAVQWSDIIPKVEAALDIIESTIAAKRKPSM